MLTEAQNAEVMLNWSLKNIDEEISKIEKELANMIGELTGSEFDMKGLEDFRSLFNGE